MPVLIQSSPNLYPAASAASYYFYVIVLLSPEIIFSKATFVSSKPSNFSESLVSLKVFVALEALIKLSAKPSVLIPKSSNYLTTFLIESRLEKSIVLNSDITSFYCSSVNPFN